MSDRSLISFHTKTLSIWDFLIDFFGCLMPGFLFACLLLILIFRPLVTAQEHIALLRFLQVFRFEVIAFLVIFSYVIGFIFYRCDPRYVDFMSCLRNKKEINDPQKRGKYAVRFKDPDKPIIEDVKYPYRYLKEYLNHRGLGHLAIFVSWSGDEEETISLNSEAFINTIKTRMLFKFPDKCGNIIKNEAQIRLISSVWYMFRSVLWMSGSGVGLGILIGLITKISAPNFYLELLVINITAFVGAMIGLQKIEQFFHLQREREIVYLLETYYNAVMTPLFPIGLDKTNQVIAQHCSQQREVAAALQGRND